MPEPDSSAPPVAPEVIDQLLLVMTTGVSEATVRLAATTKLKLTEPQAETALAECRRRITLAADYHRDAELGLATIRLDDIYRRAIALQDLKTALSATAKKADLLGLNQPKATTPKASAEAETAETPLEEAIREHLRPLGIAPERAPPEEVIRIAATILLRVKAQHARARLPSPQGTDQPPPESERGGVA